MPLSKARTLPAHVYNSQQWFEREITNVFQKNWTLVGRKDEIRKPGSYIALDVPGIGPAFVIRGKDGQVRAMANVCCHRGAVLLQDEIGTLRGGIVCPYHAWTYDTTGQLRAAPGMNEVEGFDKKEWQLGKLQLAELGGFLFVAAQTDEVPTFDQYIGNLESTILDKWPLDEMVTVGRKDYVVDCNWKFLMENTTETYHTSYVHRDSLGKMESNPASETVGTSTGSWTAVHVPSSRSIVPLPKEEAPFQEIADSTFFISMFPSVQINVTQDCLWWMRILPVGLSKSRVTQGFVFPKATTEMKDFDTLLEPYLYRWDLAVVEDNEISENQQQGTMSKSHLPGPYHHLEFGVHDFHNIILDHMVGGAKKMHS
jgi:Rieske 2Fe-2S family protein